MENTSQANDETKNAVDSADEIKRIIVLGASTGGFEAFKTIVKNLPPDFETPILLVWHMSPDIKGILPQVLNRQNKIYAAHAYNNEKIKTHRIYVAPPDHHLLVEDGELKITRGPKENNFRPAVDPLFRSAAYAYGNRVIGVVLSGALDDGTAGLWTIKHHGGIAVVQDPQDAEVSSMPENASRKVKIDYSAPLSEMANLLVWLSKQPVSENSVVMEDDQTKKEIEVARGSNALKEGLYNLAELTPFTCPDCHGVLSRLQNDNIVRYRCHTGHAYSVDALMATLTSKIENSLYSAIRGIDESIMLLNHMGDHYAEANHPQLAALYFKKAKEADERALAVRKTALTHEQLTDDSLREEASENGS